MSRFTHRTHSPRCATGSGRAVLALVLLLGTILALAPAAGATPTWLSSVRLSETAHNAISPQVVSNPQGDAIAVWMVQAVGYNAVQVVERQASGGPWQAPVTLSQVGQDAQSGQVAIAPDGEAVAVWEQLAGSHFVVQSSVRPPGGGWGAQVALSDPSSDGSEPQVAINALGEAVAVWQYSAGGHTIAQAAVRPEPGAGWQAAATLSDPSNEAYRPQVALNEEGEALVAWHFGAGITQTVQIVVRQREGAWQPPATLSGAGESAGLPQIALNDEGAAVATWSIRASGKQLIQAAGRAAPGSEWMSTATLAEGEQSFFGSPGQPMIGIDSAGGAVVAWPLISGNKQFVQAATMAPDGSWQTPATLAETGFEGSEPHLAVDARGEALAVWTGRVGSDISAEASSLSDPSGTWSAPRTLSPPGVFAFQPAAAIAADGNGFSVWDTSQQSENAIEAATFVTAGPLLNELVIPASGSVGDPLSFSVSPHDDWAELGPTSWSFGDGAVASGASVEHVFASPGTYEVAVTGEDIFGNVTRDTQSVVVSAQSGGGPPPSPAAGTAVGGPGSATPTAASTPLLAVVPKLTLLTRAPQPLINARSLILKVACGGSSCSTSSSGWLRLPGSHTTWLLKGRSTAVAAGSVGRVRLVVSRSLRHAVRSYLRRNRHYRVMVHLAVVMTGHGAPQRVDAVLPIWTYPGFR